MQQPVTIERKSYYRFASLASTYRPPDLGWAEIDMLDFFAQGKSQSAYDILKKKCEELIEFKSKPKPNYKDVHKRVQRLAELKLIKLVEDVHNVKGGPKYYRITPYGLIAFMDKSIKANFNPIVCNSDNIVIRELLSEFFEPGTIENFKFLKEFPGRILEQYLHDCCSGTTNICRRFWTRLRRTNVIDILPSDDIIQKYMLHLLDSGPVEKHVLDEIDEYEKRLKKKVKNDEQLAKAVDEQYEEQLGPEDYPRYAPFPFLNMYDSIDYLARILEKKRGFFVSSLVTELGERVKTKEVLQKDFSLHSILNDKRFCKLVTELKEVFDIGYKEFSQNEPKINDPKQESSNNKHPYGCHEDWDLCYECIDKYEELHPKQEVNPPEAHKCVPFCDQLNNKHTGIHRAMSLEGRLVENYKVNTTARQAKSKVKKGAAKTKIQAKKVARKAGTQLNKRRVQVVSAKNIAIAN